MTDAEMRMREHRVCAHDLDASVRSVHSDVENIASNVLNARRLANERLLQAQQARVALSIADQMRAQLLDMKRNMQLREANKCRPLDPHMQRQLDDIIDALQELELNTKNASRHLSEYEQNQEPFDQSANESDLHTIVSTMGNVEMALDRALARASRSPTSSHKQQMVRTALGRLQSLFIFSLNALLYVQRVLKVLHRR